MGQDFVFTVPDLPDAIRYALDELGGAQRAAWEGTAVLIIGPRGDVEEAHRVVRRRT